MTIHDAARAAAEKVYDDALAGLAVQRDTAERNATAARADVAQRDEVIADLDREVAALQARIAELETGQPEPEPPVKPRMMLGFCIPDRAIDVPFIDKRIEDIGPFQLSRDYEQGLRSGGVATHPGVKLAVERDLLVALSIKPGGESTQTYRDIAAGMYDEQIAHYLRNPPPNLRYLLVGNEPDQKGKNVDPAAYCAAVEHLFERFGPEPIPGVRWGIVLMAWTFKIGDGSVWLPKIDGPLHAEIHGYAYNDYPTPAKQFGTFVSLVKARGWTWGLGETNAYEQTDPDAKGRWLTQLADWCVANGAEYLCWFDSELGPGDQPPIASSPTTAGYLRRIAAQMSA